MIIANTQCLKITEKVSFNIASEASYVFTFFKWKKVHENMPKCSILASFWKPNVYSQTALPDRLLLIRHKLVENAQIKKFKYDIFSNFQTMWVHNGRRREINLRYYWWKWGYSILDYFTTLDLAAPTRQFI